MSKKFAPNTSTDELYLHETQNTITLHFNHEALQSVMRKNDPYGLEFEYTKVMMGFMLFMTPPKHILLVGLGGGSLSKFCYKQFPQTLITTLEISREVIQLRNTFMIPANNDYFKIIEVDAAQYMQQKEAISDVILLDGYSSSGVPPALSSEQFYLDCYNALTANGMLVVNLWRKDPSFGANLARVYKCFNKKVVSVKCESGNQIIFAFKEINLPSFDEVWKKALALKAKTGLNFPQFLEDMVFNARNNWFYTNV